MAEDKKTKSKWNNLKKELKAMDVPTLQKLLGEKRIELQKRITRQMAGSKMRMYTAEDKGKPTIKSLKKEIAIIQTFINQKIQGYKQ